MSFKMKLGEIVTPGDQGEVQLNPRIGNVIRAKRLPIKTQYHMAKIGRRLEEEVRHYREARLALVKELGEQVTQAVDGKEVLTDNWRLSPENAEEFGKKLVELLDAEVAIELDTLTIADFGEQVEGTTPDDFVACLAFILEPPSADSGAKQ